MHARAGYPPCARGGTVSLYAFLPLLFGYLAVEAWLATRRHAVDGESGPLASLWAVRAVSIALFAISWQFAWPLHPF
ncbi:MAG: hypothetical protein RLZZ383_718 [Pseudomonadota bacterium]|jgi:hypothetical protein